MATEEPSAPAANGGFPEPPEGEPVRVVRCSHLACGAETRIRLPADLETRVVHRVVCAGCATAYDTASVEDLGVPRWRRGIGDWLDRPPGKRWQLFAIPLAAVLVVEAIFLLNSLVGSSGGGEPAPARAQLVRGPTWSLVLPASWFHLAPQRGAAFAARSGDGTGDATLTVTRDPALSFAALEDRSLARLRRTAGSARVVGTGTGGAPGAASAAELSGGTPSGTGGSPPYTVTLRAAGPYRYYLQTSLSPGASAAAVAGARRIQGSFKPRGAPATGG